MPRAKKSNIPQRKKTYGRHRLQASHVRIRRGEKACKRNADHTVDARCDLSLIARRPRYVMSANLAKLDAVQSNTIERILDALDRSEERLRGHYACQRKQQRIRFRGVVALLIPSELPGVAQSRVDVIARNISSSGLSFIHTGRLMSTRLIVGLSSDPFTVAWVQADVVRAREVESGFWEFGVAFRKHMVM